MQDFSTNSPQTRNPLLAKASIDTDPLSREQLKELLMYNPGTGIFTWKVDRGNTVRKNDIAGSTSSHGYTIIKINGKRYRGHRLAWLYVYGEWPDDKIDHENQIRDDNRIENLRSVSLAGNSKNLKRYSNNSSGVCGVYVIQTGKKWCARIMVGAKSVYLGSFDDWFNAVCARKSAEKDHGFHKNHGGVPNG